MKTWSVALCLCLNIGVDPPDVVKTSPCARQECWIGNYNIVRVMINVLCMYTASMSQTGRSAAQSEVQYVETLSV